jgi:C1A family cysteine protease
MKDHHFVLASQFPATFDLRGQEKLTRVRDQGNCGSCWAFATYGSLESFLMPLENWDFSEEDMNDHHGFDWGPCAGGNIDIAVAYLTRWDGPLKEEDNPYQYAISDSANEVKHVLEAVYLPPRSNYLDNDRIKQAVQSTGAVYVSMYYARSCYNATYHSYYNQSLREGGHAVCVVGWDDNFNRNNFNQIPPGDGAFIVRNSWGNSWGEGGYFYVSYYDEFFGRRYFSAAIKAEPATYYDVLYQYDPLGWTNSFGFGSETGWFANIFTSSSNNPLSAVGFYAVGLTSDYEISVYINPPSGQPTKGTLAAVKTGSLNSSGYFTVSLDHFVNLSPGQKFSVVVKLRTNGYNYPIPCEFFIGNYSSGARANPGESFVSPDGSTWDDIHTGWGGMYANTNVCLKAYAGYPPVYPPTNFNIQKLENDFVFFKEYVNRLTWEPNSKNKTSIVKYRIYRKEFIAPTQSYRILVEVWPEDLLYDDRGLKQDQKYSYKITCVDEYDRESDSVEIANTT